jgi:hypothetical protein
VDTTTAPDTTAMMHGPAVRAERTPLWWGALLTALVAVLFPRLNAVLHENQAFWQLDTEAAVGIPVIVAVTLALFSLLGRWAWRRDNTRNRPAKVGFACGVLALVGVVAFFVSAPIVVGGLAATLGLEGMRRAAFEGNRRSAVAAIVLGSVAVLAGAIIWLAA